MAAADEIRPFFHAPEAELADLPRRINATRRPERLTGCAARHDSKAGALVRDGVRLAQVQARLNALPNFITNVDGRHSLHPRASQAECVADARHAWMARLPAGISADEIHAWDRLDDFGRHA